MHHVYNMRERHKAKYILKASTCIAILTFMMAYEHLDHLERFRACLLTANCRMVETNDGDMPIPVS